MNDPSPKNKRLKDKKVSAVVETAPEVPQKNPVFIIKPECMS
jgi:hypothetical protein